MNFPGASEILHRLLYSLLSPLKASALVLPNGSALYVEPSTPADVATLPQAASLCHRYLKLADGDVALTNDPYSGGTVLSDFTLVLGIRLASQGTESDLLLARRFSLAPRLPITGKLDDEGVRVPPTPLASSGQVNNDLLLAISAHPMAPKGLAGAVTDALSELRETAKILKNLAREPGTLFGKLNFDAYIEDSSRAFDALMTKLPLGTSLASCQFSTGETLKLQLKITESRVWFDFAGSEASPKLGLTELATFGACWAAIVATAGEMIPINAGTLQHLQVTAPQKTILSSALPIGTHRGMTEGISVVTRLALDALAKIHPASRSSQTADSNGCFQLHFDDGRVLNFEAPPGSGATSTGDGTDGTSPWTDVDRIVKSPESIEENFPVLALSAGVRTGSGGKGKFAGGNGSMIAFQCLKPAELKWFAGGLGRKPEGYDSGRAGTQGAIEIVRAKDNTKREEHTSLSGNVRLLEGDQVFVLAGGAGGFGAPAESEG